MDAELGAPTPRLAREAVFAGRADDVGVERALGKGCDLVPVRALLGRQLEVDAITPFLDRVLISRNLEGADALSVLGGEVLAITAPGATGLSDGERVDAAGWVVERSSVGLLKELAERAPRQLFDLLGVPKGRIDDYEAVIRRWARDAGVASDRPAEERLSRAGLGARVSRLTAIRPGRPARN